MKVLSSPAVKKALDEVIPVFERETGISVEATFEPTAQLLKRIDASEAFDVMIAVTESFEPLAPTIDLHTLTPVARAGIGIAVGPGAPAPDISTAEAFVRTIRAARSVAYSGTGTSGPYFVALLDKLGLTQEVGTRAIIVEKGYVAQAVVTGRADVAVQQLSELLFVPEARIVGPFPPELQHYTRFSAAVSAQSNAPAAAKSFIAFLTSATAHSAYRRTMLELPTALAQGTASPTHDAAEWGASRAFSTVDNEMDNKS